MIAKIRRGAWFKGLYDYLMSEAKGLADDDVELRNLVSLETAAIEMRLAASRSARVKRPVYHLIVAWREDERPSRSEMFEVCQDLIERLGLSEHQALVRRHKEPKAGAVPGDGRHYEMHLLINRVGPNGRAAKMRHDFAQAERAIAAIAEERFMRVVPGRFNGREGFVQGSSEKARSIAASTGRLSVGMDLKDRPEVMAQFIAARARGWPALIDAFAEHGIRLQESKRTIRKGQSAGLVISVMSEPDRIDKLSALDSPSLKWGRPTLERELGPFPIEAAKVPLFPPPFLVSVSPSPALHRRADFDAAREAALAERRRMSQAHDEAKRRLLSAQAGERRRLVSTASQRRRAVNRFFGRGSEVARAINYVLDESFAERLSRTLDEQRHYVETIVDRHHKALARAPVPTWTDWRRAGRHIDDESRSTSSRRGPHPEAEQSRSVPISDRRASDQLTAAPVASLMMSLDEHERRRERLRRNRERRVALHRGNLDAKIAALADDMTVAIAASVIRHLRSQDGPRMILLIIAALAAGSGIAPVVLAAAAAALIRRGMLKAERAVFRADVDAVKAARTGWKFPDARSSDRARYAALARSSLIAPDGPDAGPVIAAVGQPDAARFVAWWAYATPKQRAVVEGWEKQRDPKRRPTGRRGPEIGE